MFFHIEIHISFLQKHQNILSLKVGIFSGVGIRLKLIQKAGLENTCQLFIKRVILSGGHLGLISQDLIALIHTFTGAADFPQIFVCFCHLNPELNAVFIVFEEILA